MSRISLSEWAALIERQAAAVEPAAAAALRQAAPEVAEIAKSKFGHYQPGWPALAPSTLAEKTQQGFAPPDNPLLRGGDLRDSVGAEAVGLALIVGSADPVIKFHEFGTSRMPARPVIGPALLEAMPRILGAVGRGLRRAMTIKE